MAVKAVALIQAIGYESETTFQVSVRWVYFDNTGSSGDLLIEGLSTGITQLTLESTIKAAIKDALSIGALDTVRLIGATI